tara:strand:+ start:545 stop:742 length:198 start_codon:yes stop_codon:yes gene_type:complete
MMCIICVEIQKGKLTSKEARSNMFELRSELDDEHKLEVLKQIWKKEEQEEQAEFNELLEWLRDQE